MVGNFIYDYIEKAYGQERSPKLCGMMVDLPYIELLDTCKSLDQLEAKLSLANELLTQSLAKSSALAT